MKASQKMNFLLYHRTEKTVQIGLYTVTFSLDPVSLTLIGMNLMLGPQLIDRVFSLV